MARNRRPIPLSLIAFATLTFFCIILFLRPSKSSANHAHVTTPAVEPPFQQRSPVCSIWPGWRELIPNAVAADDAALSQSRVGTPDVMGRGHGCVPALQRLGPFGHEGYDGQYEDKPWQSLRWGRMQSDCVFASAPNSSAEADSTTTSRPLRWPNPALTAELRSNSLDGLKTGRTAVVFRTWNAFDYTPNQLAWIRAVIAELAMDTGGRFQVYFLVNIKEDVNLRDPAVFSEAMARSVPEELRDLALLFNEELLREWYPKTMQHSPTDQMYQALQIFSYTFPEFDYVWQMEMDVRFTGNIADMLTSAAAWARAQKRQHLWERNARFYIPALWNHSYSNFSAQVDADIGPEDGVWGPHHNSHFFVDAVGPIPPSMQDAEWGVDEEAELLNFAPIIDTVGTRWIYEHTVHSIEPSEYLPRRMAMVSVTRTSRRLLRLISWQQREIGTWFPSEATPETFALLHGLKAVYVPHLFAFELPGRKPPSAKELEKALHKGPLSSLAGGLHASFLWCYDLVDGLPEGLWYHSTYFYRPAQGHLAWQRYIDGICTYPLMLHPVK